MLLMRCLMLLVWGLVLKFCSEIGGMRGSWCGDGTG